MKNNWSSSDAKKYINKYKEELIVIKYGGNVLIDRNIFNNFIEDISILNKLGLSIIVVHGGGPRIERKLKEENIQTKYNELKTDYDAKAYARKRATEYPSVQDFMEAYTEKEIGGNDTKWNEYKTKYNKVRTDNPKE